MNTDRKLTRSPFALSLIAACAGLPTPLAYAAETGAPNPDRLAQAQAALRLISEDLGSMVAYRPMMAPGGGTGTHGLDIGTAVLFNQIRNRDVLAAGLGGAAGAQDVPAALPQYALRIDKGLPLNGSNQSWNLDAGLSLSKVVDADITVVGANLRWGFVEERQWLPAMSLRLAVSKLVGVDQLALKTTSYDIGMSKSFYLFTPYIGIGQVAVSATPAGGGLQAEEFTLLRTYAGINLAVRQLNLLMEVDKTGEAANLGVKLGFRY